MKAFSPAPVAFARGLKLTGQQPNTDTRRRGWSWASRWQLESSPLELTDRIWGGGRLGWKGMVSFPSWRLQVTRRRVARLGGNARKKNPEPKKPLLTTWVRGFCSVKGTFPPPPIPPSSSRPSPPSPSFPPSPPVQPTAAGLYLAVNLWPLLCS